jgi:hypothetical protein
MHRIAENEDSLNGIRSDVRSAHIGIILPDDPFDCVSHSEFLAAVFLSDSSRSRSLSTATTSYPWPANARAFLPNPHGASKIGSLYDEATRSRNCIKDLDGMSEVGSLALDTGPISPNDYRKDPALCVVVPAHYGCCSFLAARIPCAAVSRSHMYAPSLVVP